MDETARALSDLSAIDDQIAGTNGGGPASVLVRRRGALRKTIAPVHLAAYDALGRFHRRPVIVAVRRSHCGGCHLRVPPQLESSLRRFRGLAPCPHCHRLLYVSGAAQQSAVPAGDRPASAAAAAPRSERPAPRPRAPGRPASVPKAAGVEKPRHEKQRRRPAFAGGDFEDAAEPVHALPAR